MRQEQAAVALKRECFLDNRYSTNTQSMRESACIKPQAYRVGRMPYPRLKS